ncbi:MAG: phosphoribosylglycinamide formyltransferase [Candidatus Tokpelaia sp. JSC085]|nr:MAG: phosphoribosylglycinamide formyltransferase [Candidatus Tokpelaia sp. JSC085]
MSNNKRTRVVVLISGHGSNMEALIKAAEMPDYPAFIVAVISDRPDAIGLEKAKKRNIPVHLIDRANFASKTQHEKAILQILDNYQADIICLAGYMRLISSYLITPYYDRILNIHPSLLPLFPGLETHQRAIDSGIRITGCTVHIVTEEIDQGLILAQAAVPIYRDDSKDTLARRVLKAEHCLYPTALHYFICEKKASVPIHENQILFSF